MVNGLEKFREKFANFKDEYVVIGGTACSILMEHVGLSFRATKDIDMILVIDASGHAEYAKALWEFIKEGDYKCYVKNDETHFYRFANPKDGYPLQIELFSRNPSMLSIPGGIARLPISEDVSSLSAIVLDNDYYDLLKTGCDIVNGIRVLKPEYLILFKMFARINLEQMIEDGKQVNDRDLKKHKNDVFRLLQLLPTDLRLTLPESVRTHVGQFISAVNEDVVDVDTLGISMSKEDAVDLLRTIYSPL